MADGKNTIVVYKDWISIFEKLDDDEAGRLAKHLWRYINDQNPTSDRVTEIIFQFIKIKLDADKSKLRIGINHWNWKGGISNENQVIRNSTDIKIWRREVFERDLFTCQSCCVKGGVLHAHHIKSFSKYPELRFDINNGITLCKSCHIKTHKLLKNGR